MNVRNSQYLVCNELEMVWYGMNPTEFIIIYLCIVPFLKSVSFLFNWFELNCFCIDHHVEEVLNVSLLEISLGFKSCFNVSCPSCFYFFFAFIE